LERSRKIIALWLATGLGAAILLLLLTLGNYRYASQNTGANDFLIHWIGTKNFVFEGVSPYSDETALAAQQIAYGRPARNGESELRETSPLYSILVYLPFSLLNDFILSRALWMTVLEVALILIGYLSLRMTAWKLPIWLMILYFIFTIFWYHSFQPLSNGSVVILVCLAMTGGILALKNKSDELAGVLLAFCMIKPLLALILTIFFYYWTIKNRRYKFIIWHMSILGILILSSLLLMPDWPMQNLRETIHSFSPNSVSTFGKALASLLPGIGQRVGWVMTGLMALILLFEWRASIHSGTKGLLWCACLTLVASQWIGIPTDPGNFIIMFPGLALAFSLLEKRWVRIGNLLTMLSFLFLFVGIWLIFFASLPSGLTSQQSSIMFFPLPGFMLVILYWVRWWAIKPPKLWFDEISDDEDL
jgi:hypothetical protein